MARHAIACALALVFAGCSVESGNLPDLSPSSPGEPSVNETRGDDATAPASPHDDEADCRRDVGSDRREQVCQRWSCEGRNARVAAQWHGDPSTCSAGELDADAGTRAVALVNLHRFLADIEPVASEPSWSSPAQQCALLAHANAKLSHTPARDWRCWSDEASVTSAISLIANRSAPLAIGAFIEDPGNELTMVHRRWLLSEELAFVGLGSTDRYACVVVDGTSLSAAAPRAATLKSSVAPRPRRGWVAWPPAGPVPMAVFTSEHLDESGWTVQSGEDDLDSASLTVTDAGKALAVHVTRLTPLLGSRSALRFVPSGWKTEPGRRYTVSVRGARSFDYEVEPVDCNASPP